MKILSERGGVKVSVKGKRSLIHIGLVILPIVALFGSLFLGRYYIPPEKVAGILVSPFSSTHSNWTRLEESIVLNLRLPRVLTALLVSSSLAISGAAFQGVFKNPLVSSYILGVSSGAALGVALCVILGSTYAPLLQFFSFVFGIVAVVVASAISKIRGEPSPLKLALGGIVVGSFLGALHSILVLIADPDTQLPYIVYWSMGSVANTTFRKMWMSIPFMLVGVVILLLLRWRINILSLGDEDAKTLGVDVERTRWLLVGAATLATSASISLAGPIGWIGLVVPHIGRQIVGPDNSVLLPAAACLGGAYLILIDDVARTLTPSEIPLGLLTAIIGLPIFVYFLTKKASEWK